MSYFEEVKELSNNPEKLEEVFQTAVNTNELEPFKEAINANYASDPENLLFAAWFYRLKHIAAQAKSFVIAWAWVIPLAVITGLVFWLLSDDRFIVQIKGFLPGTSRDFLPVIFLLAAPIAAMSMMIYQTRIGKKDWRLSAIIGACLAAASAYVLLVYPRLGIGPFQEQYLTLMVLHLPILAWAGVGALLLSQHRDPKNRFAFLIKSLEVIVFGGLFLIAGVIFTGITIGLFEAINVSLPEEIMRLFVAGGVGLVAVVAVAVMYNPTVPPSEQSFSEGLSKLVALLMRLMLPLTLFVLIIYIIFIPFNFRAPFENRDVLVIYNIMLFAVVALLVGATPISLNGVSPRLATWLRIGIIAVAALAVLVSLYALAALLYRASLYRLTPNRFTFIGWNIINISLLVLLLIFQVRAKKGRWLSELYRAYSLGTVAYVIWAIFLLLTLPWLFGTNQASLENLPEQVQRIIFEEPEPILLKCATSPHIYLIENGEKRWVDTIETFEDRGYLWSDVRFISCSDLRSIPDGIPIPEDAGPPPQP